MHVQTIEIRGERFVLLPEKEFLELKTRGSHTTTTEVERPHFRVVVPLQIGRVPASEMLLQDRR